MKKHLYFFIFTLGTLSFYSYANDTNEGQIPQALIKNNQSQKEKTVKNHKNDIIINNKPVKEVPIKNKKENSNNKQKQKENMEFRFTQKFKKYGVRTCAFPIKSIADTILMSPNIQDISYRVNVVDSKTVEPVVFMDYNAVYKKDKNKNESMNLSLEAVPFTKKGYCFITQTYDYVLNDLPNCETIINSKAVKNSKSFNISTKTKNQHDLNLYYAQNGNRQMTFNNMPNKGCHVREIIYSQYKYQKSDQINSHISTSSESAQSLNNSKNSSKEIKNVLKDLKKKE